MPTDQTPAPSASAPEWRSDEGQRAALERRAAAEGVEPYDLLIQYASGHGAKADIAERYARELRKSEQSCRNDARRWYSRIPVDQAEVGQTIWIYMLDMETGWDWERREVVGKGTKPTELYGDVPFLRLRDGEREYDWTPGPDMEVDLKDPRHG